MKLDLKFISFFYLILSLLGCSFFDAEEAESYVTYKVTLGGNGYSAAQDVIETEEGYVLVGTIGPQCDIVDGYVAQVDKQTGITLNIKTLGNSNQGFEENFFSMTQSQGGGFKAIGFALEKLRPSSPEDLHCLNKSGDGQLFLGSVDENFEESSGLYFEKDSLWDSGFDIMETANGDLLVAGSWNLKIAVMLIVDDTISRVIQSDNFIGNGFKMLLHSSGRIFLTGESYDNNNIYWGELDLSANRFINERIFSFETRGDWQTSLVHAMVETPDGNMLLAGKLRNNDRKDDILLRKTDLEGNELMFKGISLGTNDSALDMIALDDGYIITGKATIPDITTGTDALIAKIDEEGNILWKEYHDFGGNSEWGNSLIQTSDGGFLLAGRTVNFDNGIQTILLVKTDAEGKVE